MVKSVLAASALIEAGAGLGLLLVPSTVVWLLFGLSFDAPVELAVARVAGAALLSLGVACWLTRLQDNSAHGLVVGMLLYNIAVGTILGIAGGSGMAGLVLLPAVGVHAVMAVWCLLNVRRPRVQY